jgi:hypothetical protein
MAATSVAQATVIDSFESGTQFLFVYSGIPAADNVTGPYGAIAGQYRDSQLEWLSGAGADTLDIALDIDSSLNFSVSSAASARATVIWDGDAAAGLTSFALGNLDLTANGHLGLSFPITAAHGQMTIEATLYSNSQDNYAVGTINLPAGYASGPATLFMPFSSFTVTGAFDFADVDAAKLSLTGTNGGDISMGSFATAVPEPATWLLALLAVAGSWFVHRVRRG